MNAWLLLGLLHWSKWSSILGVWGGKKTLSWSWGDSSSDIRGLMPTSLLTIIEGFPRSLVPVWWAGAGAGRPKSKGLGCIARTGRIWGRMAERSPGLPYGPQEGTEGSIPFCLVWSDPPLLQLVSFLALKK